MPGRRPRIQLFLHVLMPLLAALFACAVLPSAASAVTINDVQITVAAHQVTITWKTDVSASSEIRWDSERHATFADFPAYHDESNTAYNLGTTHSRTLGYLPAGNYWVMVRSRNSLTNYRDDIVRTFSVAGDAASGSMARLVMSGSRTGYENAPGKITASTSVGNRAYIAGDFRRIGVRTGRGVVVGTTGGSLGDVIAGLPEIDGDVLATKSDGNGGWFIGGNFRTVGGLDRAGIAHILPDGGVDPVFNPGTGVRNGDAVGTVEALEIDSWNYPNDPRLYIGGGFRTYYSQTNVVNNIVAVSSRTGKVDPTFRIKDGNNIGTDAPVYAVLADKRLAGVPAVDYAGVYIGGAFSHFRGMEFSKVAKLELSGDRSEYTYHFDTTNSPEWTIIKQIAGEEATQIKGKFESCDIGMGTSNYGHTVAAGTNANPADRCPPSNDTGAGTRSYPVNTSVKDVDISDGSDVVTSLAIYDQSPCATVGFGAPTNRPRGIAQLNDIPILGFFTSLLTVATAVLNKNSESHEYMSDWMYWSVSKSYDRTLILGGNFKTVRNRQGGNEAVNPTNSLTGLDAATGTAQLDDVENHGLRTLENLFPELGQRIRLDPKQTNFRFSTAGITGVVTALAVADRPGADVATQCGNDSLFVAGDFTTKTNQHDLVEINLTPGYGQPWTVDTQSFKTLNGPIPPATPAAAERPGAGTDGHRVEDIELDNAVNPTQLFAVGNFMRTDADDPERESDRTYVTRFDPASGSITEQNSRDGVDGRIRTLSLAREGATIRPGAFVGGEFSTYDSFYRPGLAVLTSPQDDRGGQLDIDRTFAPSGLISGRTASDVPDITSIAVADTKVFVGGTFGRVVGDQRLLRQTPKVREIPVRNLAAFDATHGDVDPTVGVGGGGPRGPVHAMVATDGHVVIGGAFSGYDVRAANGSIVRECVCSNVAVIQPAFALPAGYKVNANGSTYGDYEYSTLNVDGPVNALAAATGRVYIGGAFTHYGKDLTPRGGLLSVKSLDGTLDTKFHAKPGGFDGRVNALAVTSDALFAGGAFTKYRGATARNLAKIDRVTGAIDPEFNAPGTDQPITELRTINNALFIAGAFTNYGGAPRPGLAQVDGSEGSIVTSFDPVDGSVASLTTVGDHLVLGGSFAGIPGVDGNSNAVTIDPPSDSTEPFVQVSVTSVADKSTVVDGVTFYAPGHYPAVSLSVEAHDTATFAGAAHSDGTDDASRMSIAGLSAVKWPSIPGATIVDGANQDPSKATGLDVSCVAGDAAPTGADAVAVPNFGWSGAGDRPAAVTAKLSGGTTTCRYHGYVIAPTDVRGDNLQLRLVGGGSARTAFGSGALSGWSAVAAGGNGIGVRVAAGRAVEVTIDWRGKPADVASLKLQWRDDGPSWAGDSDATPNAERWQRVPRMMLARQITFVRTYQLTEAVDLAALNFTVTATDSFNRAAVSAATSVQPDETPGAATVFAPVTGSPSPIFPSWSPSGTPKLSFQTGERAAGLPPIVMRELQVQRGTYGPKNSTSGVTCVEPLAGSADDWHLAKNLLALGPKQQGEYVPSAPLADGCYRYRIVTRDSMNLAQYDTLGDGLGWIFVDTSKPTIDLSGTDKRWEGPVVLKGKFNDGGVGVGRYTVNAAWRPNALQTTRGTEFACDSTAQAAGWSCSLDTTGANGGPGVADGLYDLAVVGFDTFGQRSTTATDVVHVDNEGPQLSAKLEPITRGDAGTQDSFAHAVGTKLWFNPNHDGAVKLTVVGIDDGSGIGVLDIPIPGEGWTEAVEPEVDAPATERARGGAAIGLGSPTLTRTLAWSEGSAAPAAYSVVGTETAGKSTTETVEFLADGSAPSTELTDVQLVDGVVQLAFTAVEDNVGGAGVRALGIVRKVGAMVTPDTCAGAEWSSEWSAPVSIDLTSTTSSDAAVSDGTCYQYGVRVADNVGNVAIVPSSAELRVGNIAAPPTEPVQEVSVPTPAEPIVTAEPTPVAPTPTEPAPTEPTPVTPPPVLREQPNPTVEKPLTPVDVEPVAETPAPQVATPTPRVIKAKPPVARPPAKVITAPAPAVQERRTASAPKAKSKPTKNASWIERSGDWVKEHPVSTVVLGAAATHLGGTLLVGKGLGGLLGKFNLHLPFGIVRRIVMRLWSSLRSRRDEDEDELDDDDEDEDDPWAELPAPYRQAA